jgi:hypothetical protein
MSDRVKLERRYRRMLAWYPRSFRRESGSELLAVLMACAPDGQRRPGLAELADLIRNGLRMRLRPSRPQSVRTVRAAVRLMYAGASVSAVSLMVSIISLAFTGRSGAAIRLAGSSQPFWVAVTVGIASGLGITAVWLWLARVTSQGQNWARILCTVLLGLSTLELISFSESGTVLGLVFWAPTWLAGVAAVGLLWHPDSRSFFKSSGLGAPGHSA